MVLKITNKILKQLLSKFNIPHKKSSRKNVLVQNLKNTKVVNLKKILKSLGLKKYSKQRKEQLQNRLNVFKNKYKTKAMIKAEIKQKKAQKLAVKLETDKQSTNLKKALINLKINEDVKEVIVGLKADSQGININLLKLPQILKLIKKTLKGQRPILNVNNEYITLGTKSFANLLELYDDATSYMVQTDGGGVSDEEWYKQYIQVDNMRIILTKDKFLKDGKLKIKPQIAFFRYLSKCDKIDLSRCGVFNEIKKISK